MRRTVTWYSPGARPSNAYAPLLAVVAVTSRPVASNRATIAASPSGAPLESVTYPRTLPVVVCARPVRASTAVTPTRSNATRRTHRTKDSDIIVDSSYRGEGAVDSRTTSVTGIVSRRFL